MGSSDPPTDPVGRDTLPPDEAFALLGSETRVGILQALWDAFESATGDNALSYSEVFDRVDIVDSGNFSYHLEKLIGPFVRRTEDGYELKQTGINVVRAVVAGTVIDDPAFGPTEIDVPCPRCEAPVEVAYADELVTVACTACEGMLCWDGEPGFLFLGLVPPPFIEQRPVEAAFRAAVTYVLHEIAAMADGVCPHCSSPVRSSVDACREHDPGARSLCPTCERAHVADCSMVCTTCKRNVFPPVRTVILGHPAVTAFYHEHAIEHRFASWDTLVRSSTVEEELLSADPFRLSVAIPAGDDELRLTVDDELHVLDVAQ